MESAHDHTDEAHAAMRQAVAEAVAKGIKDAASDPELWAAALDAMKRRAAGATGNMVLETVVSLMKRAAWLAVLVAGLYALGGGPAVTAAVKAYWAAK